MIKTAESNSPCSGTSLCSMTALLQVPPELSAKDLQRSLTDMGDAQSVDITLKLANMKEEEPESRRIFTLIMCLIYGGLAALIIGLIWLLDRLTL